VGKRKIGIVVVLEQNGYLEIFAAHFCTDSCWEEYSYLVGTVSSRSRALASPSARSERAKARKWLPSISQDQGKSMCFPSPSDFLEKLNKSQERKLETKWKKIKK
jgi:hypothetical protein